MFQQITKVKTFVHPFELNLSIGKALGHFLALIQIHQWVWFVSNIIRYTQTHRHTHRHSWVNAESQKRSFNKLSSIFRLDEQNKWAHKVFQIHSHSPLICSIYFLFLACLHACRYHTFFRFRFLFHASLFLFRCSVPFAFRFRHVERRQFSALRERTEQK